MELVIERQELELVLRGESFRVVTRVARRMGPTQVARQAHEIRSGVGLLAPELDPRLPEAVALIDAHKDQLVGAARIGR